MKIDSSQAPVSTRIDDLEENERGMGYGVIPGVGRVYIKLSGLNANFPFFGFFPFFKGATKEPVIETGPTMALHVLWWGKITHVPLQAQD